MSVKPLFSQNIDLKIHQKIDMICKKNPTLPKWQIINFLLAIAVGVKPSVEIKK